MGQEAGLSADAGHTQTVALSQRTLHYSKLDGLTSEQHEKIFQRVYDLMDTDPADLLEKHQYLLEGDFYELGDASAGVRQTWIASIESALEAAKHVRLGKPTRGNPGTFPSLTSNITPRPSADGSVVYRSRRQREPQGHLV